MRVMIASKYLQLIALLWYAMHTNSEKSIPSRMRSSVSRPVIWMSKLLVLSQATQLINLKLPAYAADIDDDINILKSRIDSKNYSQFRPGKQNGDIFYPPW